MELKKINLEGNQDTEVISEKAAKTNCPLMVETERFEKENIDPTLLR